MSRGEELKVRMVYLTGAGSGATPTAPSAISLANYGVADGDYIPDDYSLFALGVSGAIISAHFVSAANASGSAIYYLDTTSASLPRLYVGRDQSNKTLMLRIIDKSAALDVS